jgi:hypothetical protein
MVLGIFELESHHSGLAVLLLNRFVTEFVRINAVGLRIVSCSLLVWHDISFLSTLLYN